MKIRTLVSDCSSKDISTPEFNVILSAQSLLTVFQWYICKISQLCYNWKWRHVKFIFWIFLGVVRWAIGLCNVPQVANILAIFIEEDKTKYGSKL